eukprot:scaffold7181_cov128-Skeletonema_marinoi.AAC.6
MLRVPHIRRYLGLGPTQMPQLHVEEVCDDATTKHFSQRLSLIGVAVGLHTGFEYHTLALPLCPLDTKPFRASTSLLSLAAALQTEDLIDWASGG